MYFDTLFIDEREKGETPLRQSHLVMLRMLKIFDYLCVRHGIRYFLTGGTLLGAIRHQGFIPWDDDLDIGMTRAEYEKFVKLAVPELPNDIFFQTPETDPHYSQKSNVDARLRDNYSSYDHTEIENHKWHEGLQVDIFVYDRAFLPHNAFIVAQNALLKRLNNKKKRAKVLKMLSRFSPLGLVYASSFLQSSGAIKMGTNYVRAEEIATLQRKKFEDAEFYVPQGWDACLKRQYGDYMKLPPEDKRQSHHKVTPFPFTPCNHTEILYWKDRKVVHSQTASD